MKLRFRSDGVELRFWCWVERFFGRQANALGQVRFEMANGGLAWRCRFKIRVSYVGHVPSRES